MDIKERFWSKTRVNNDHEWNGSNCIDWTALKYSFGYGRHYMNKKQVMAHRASFELFVGEIPSGLCVCHRCDRPECVNPAHLFLGTNKQNSEDRVQKGRQAKGSKNGRSVLTEDIVRTIRKFLERHPEGSKRFVGEWFGVSDVMVGKISRRTAWRDVK